MLFRSRRIASIAADTGLPLARIGSVVPGRALRVLDEHGKAMTLASRGFDHFSGQSPA